MVSKSVGTKAPNTSGMQGQPRKRKNHFEPARDIPRYLLILPALVLLIVFSYGPIYGIVIAFQDFSVYKGIFGSEFVGLKYFKMFLSSANFWLVLRNTLMINLQQLIFGLPFPVIFALMLNEIQSKVFKRTIQTISYLPHFISWVVVASIVSSILSPTTGVVNVVMKNVFGMEPVYFLSKSQYFQGILVGSSVWKNFGMAAVYYIATLSGIDPCLYEAARIDGANRWKQTLHVTIPGILPMFVLLMVLNVGKLVSIGFEQVYLLYNPSVYEVGDVISTYTYRLGIEHNQFSMTTAVGVAQSVVNFILVMTANKVAKMTVGYHMW